jgi:serine/threonine-protein kinase
MKTWSWLLLMAGLSACTGTTSGVDTGGGAGGGGGGGSGGLDAGSTGGGGTASAGLFSQPEPWTKDVSALPASSESAAIISALNALGGWGTTSLRTDFSLVVLEAPAGATRVNVVEGSNGYTLPDCEPLPATMPLPAAGSIEGESGWQCTQGGDCHVLIVARSERKLYELYQANRQAGGDMETSCLVIWDLDRAYPDNVRGDQCTSVDAAGLPVAALTATPEEVFAGEVPHALRFILPNARMAKGVYVHPASHAGGPSSTNASAPPYGVRFRLKASFDESSLASPGAKVLARALKKYGMILSDGGNLPLTMGSDTFAQHTWAEVGITDSHALAALTPDDFEVVDLGARIPLTYDCVRNP